MGRRAKEARNKYRERKAKAERRAKADHRERKAKVNERRIKGERRGKSERRGKHNERRAKGERRGKFSERRTKKNRIHERRAKKMNPTKKCMSKWRCGVNGLSTPVSIAADGNVQCMSTDAKNCW